jgi:hypothetical protein
MINQLKDIVQDRQISLPEVKAAYEAATDRRAILANHKDDYLKQDRNYNMKTQKK